MFAVETASTPSDVKGTLDFVAERGKPSASSSRSPAKRAGAKSLLQFTDSNVGSPSDPPFGVPHNRHLVEVSQADTCTIQVNNLGGIDPVTYLYDGPIDPGNQNTNLVQVNDDGAGYPNSLIGPVALAAGVDYTIVVRGYGGSTGTYEVLMNCPVATPSIAGLGVTLENPASNDPVLVAEELVIPPSRTILNTGNLDISTEVSYSFSPGEVRYARLHCPGIAFDGSEVVTYSGDPSNLIGAVNTTTDGAIYFSITAGATPVVAGDSLVVDGDRTIAAQQPIDCTYGLYDFPSQAQAGGAPGRVATTSGAYIRFAPSYALQVDMQGNPIADVESNEPAYSEFVVNAPTFSEFEGNIGGFSYGTVAQVQGTAQPITLDGQAIELADLMDGDTALVFSGDFSTANDVFFSPASDCSVNIQSADDFDASGAVFTIGANPAMNHYLCYETDGVPIRASEFTVALAPVSADDTTYEVGGRGPLALGAITRNGTELQAPLAQVPGGWLSRLVLTNTGSQDRAYEIAVFGEDGTTISTANLTGTVPANGTRVVDLTTVLTGFTGGLPRATLNVTVAAPNNQIQGLYQIVNQGSGSISNHVMVRPGTN